MRPACTLNQELALFRKVRSAAPRLLCAVSLVGVGRQAEPHVIVEPVMPWPPTATCVQLVETWRVLITHHQIGLVTAQAAATHQQVVVSGRRRAARKAAAGPAGNRCRSPRWAAG